MLTGKIVELRPLKESDKEHTLKWRNDLSLIKLTQGIRFPKTNEMENEWFNSVLTDVRNNAFYFAIVLKVNNSVDGIIQVTQIDWLSRKCQIGLSIGAETDRGKGVGYESMQLLINYLSEILNIRKISLSVVAYNQCAISLYRKLGFTLEGTLKEEFYWEGKYHDVLIFALFK